MATAPSLSSLRQQLNPAQLQAVDAIEGPVMVLAGPGTGKTQVLSARIANILATTDTEPGSVLALTFTDAASKNMRQRLVSMIGVAAYHVQIHTFHSFCKDILTTYPEYFPIDSGTEPLSDLERHQIFDALLDGVQLDLLRPVNAPKLYLRDVIRVISQLKRENISPQRFQDILDQEKIGLDEAAETLTQAKLLPLQKKYLKNCELLLVYSGYQEQLSQLKRYDFDDMIGLVVTAFEKHDELTQQLQEKLLYILVDEYQDTNAAQNKVIELLTAFWGEEANVFVVGDPNQAIYRFQGATLENVVGFTERYPNAHVISLQEGYRSPQEIYDAAAHLIASAHPEKTLKSASKPSWLAALSQPLVSTKQVNQALTLFAAPSQTVEYMVVAQEILSVLAEGIEPSEIAILYRNNADATDLLPVLEAFGIEYELDGGENVLNWPIIQQLVHLIQLVVTLQKTDDDHLLYEVLQYPFWKLDAVLVMKVARLASASKKTLFAFLSKDLATSGQLESSISPLEISVLEVVMKKLQQFAVQDAAMPLVVWLQTLITESGLIAWVLEQPTRVELLTALHSFFSEVQHQSERHPDFHARHVLQILTTFTTYDLQLPPEDLNIIHGAVHVSTVHKAKGKEWHSVFLIGCLDGKWGNSKKRDKLPLPDSILELSDTSQHSFDDDDRRLLYVGLTRAQQKIHLSYPETIIQENRTKQGISSLFLEELKQHLSPLDSSASREVLGNPDQFLVKLLQPSPVIDLAPKDEAYFKELLKDFKLSVSALNTYLHSPQDFLEKYLLKIPSAQTGQQVFGTAVHAALEQLVSNFNQTQLWMPETEFVARFEKQLLLQPLEDREQLARLAHGKKILPTYYQHLTTQQKVNPLYIERFFGSGWSRAVLHDVQLVGRLDRVDWLESQNKTVRIIDYKTGKPKTVGEIEGTTASSNVSEREQNLPESIRGSYKRQLVFYVLLSQLDPTFKEKVERADFEFVEPSASGKITVRSFFITQDEVEELKKLIQEVMSEIRELTFLVK